MLNILSTALVKLTESGWRFTYYSFAVLYGFWALWDKVCLDKLKENYNKSNNFIFSFLAVALGHK